MKMIKRLQSSLRRYSRYVLSPSANVNQYHPVPMLILKQINSSMLLLKVYQPAGEDEGAAIGFRQSENSTIEENAKEVLILVDHYYRETVY